ncbi:MAG: 30S ribosomal protein S12 methylthiotransferase RimO [Anaerolineaceae bacterium]|nr:30S ribosomal protein S12 methylthiotransferase RimO [Anaerolineaceae bacterium]
MMKKSNKSYFLVSLGCAKNLVDSNAMIHLLENQGLKASPSPEKAKYIIVNTCGFIESARQESLQTIQELAVTKKPGQFLIAAGCMSQRYQDALLNMVEGIDGMLGTRRWMDIVHILDSLNSRKSSLPFTYFPIAETMGNDEKGAPAFAVQGKSSYLKIADGCRRPCAYCAIPLIKGSLVSRPMQSIVRDAIQLQAKGINEINLIAQDVTDYGRDLGIKDGFITLLETLVDEIPNIPWIRLLYTFPGFNVEKLSKLMQEHPQIIPYLDIPLQHADREVLTSMQRPSNIDQVKDSILRMRSNIPSLALRTTFIVGYPTETEKSFQNLINFIEEVKFDHLGAFPYSFEKGTPAESLEDPIPDQLKQERLSILMETQSRISSRITQALVNSEIDILIEGKDSDQNILVGRSKRDAPEVDGIVIAEGNGEIGDLVPVRINGAMVHDLTGTVIP